MRWLKRRRRIGRGDHSPLPREPSLSQLAGRPIVEAVVRSLADSDQIPATPLPAWEVLDGIDMVDCRRSLIAAIAASLAALVAITPQDRISQMQPSFALVIRPKPPILPSSIADKPKRHDLTTEIMALMPSGYHLGCKTKAPNDLPLSRSKSFGAGAGAKALAQAHIHVYDGLASAHLAVQREVRQRRRWQHTLLRRPSAQRADQLAAC